MTRPRRAVAASPRPRVHRFTSGIPRRLIHLAAAGLTVLTLGAATVGGTSPVSVAGHTASSTATSAGQAHAHHAHAAAQDVPAAFARRAQPVGRDAVRPVLGGTAAAAPEGRAARLARQRADVTQEQIDAAFAARAEQLARRASDTTKAALAKRAAERRHVFPLDHYKIVATFGDVGVWARYHTGVDFSAPLGTPIHAAAAGVVTHAGPGGGAGGWAGSYVTIEHAGGYQTLYAHMNYAITVSVGQHVDPGQLIGHVGLTGRTFGPHCHFELYPPGVKPGDIYSAINPMPWLRSSDPA